MHQQSQLSFLSPPPTLGFQLVIGILAPSCAGLRCFHLPTTRLRVDGACAAARPVSFVAREYDRILRALLKRPRCTLHVVREGTMA